MARTQAKVAPKKVGAKAPAAKKASKAKKAKSESEGSAGSEEEAVSTDEDVRFRSLPATSVANSGVLQAKPKKKSKVRPRRAGRASSILIPLLFAGCSEALSQDEGQ